MQRDFAPGYYFFVFEDPDGIRLEINYIPGKGLLASDTPLSPSDDPDWTRIRSASCSPKVLAPALR